MGNTITLRLGDALYNAGLVGFIRVCDISNLKYVPKEDHLTFNQDILKNFTQNYLDALIKIYGHETIYKEIVKKYEMIQDLYEQKRDYIKSMEDLIKYISGSTGKMERASYKAAYSIIKERGEQYDFISELKKIKKEKEQEQQYEKLSRLLKHMRKYEDVFILKDITYTKIDKFWGNVAFLNSQNNKSEFFNAYEKTFTYPAVSLESDEKSKKNINCCQCETPMKKSQGSGLSWINDLGIDINRKQSNYWEFNVDTYLCPVCYLVYSCMPLGFHMKGTAGVFVNDNESVEQLITLNRGMESEREQQVNESNLLYQVINQFIQENKILASKYQVNNIQVIRREDNRYSVNILSKNILSRIRKNKEQLEKLYRISFPISEGKNTIYLNIYREVIDRILSGKNLYDLMYEIIYEAAKEHKKIFFVQHIVMIQGGTDKKGEIRMNTMKNAGQALRTMMDEEKIRGLSFRLLNCLKTQNQHDFLDTVLRQYIGLNRPLPEAFMYISKENDKFLDAGYAFLVGLNSGNSDRNNQSEGENK